MRFRRFVGLGYGHHWSGLILDYRYKDLQRVIKQSQELFSAFEDGAFFRRSPSDLYWEWPTGETLYFRHINNPDLYEGFHGQEFAFIGWNELTKWADDQLYTKLMSINRTGFVTERDTPKDSKGNYLTPDGKPLPDIPLQVFSTTNPSGVGHGWVKERFIDPIPNGRVLRRKYNVYNPRTKQDEEVVKTQVAIFGSYHENENLPADYIASLMELCRNNERLKRAWLYGDWNITTGGAFDQFWDDEVHVIPRLKIPSHWHVDRSFDWGSRHPFAVGWWAVANGEELVSESGETYLFPKGSLIQIHEWYGATSLTKKKAGLFMSAEEVAKGILDRETEMIEQGWIGKRPLPGPADRNMANVLERQSDSIRLKFARAGVRWTLADQSSGSRHNGLQMMRDRLKAATSDTGEPGLYFMEHCRSSIVQLPTLPMDDEKDDVHDQAIDHVYDMVRYRVLRGSKTYCTDLKVKYAV